MDVIESRDINEFTYTYLTLILVIIYTYCMRDSPFGAFNPPARAKPAEQTAHEPTL